ncbi:MAG TPA: hypothetical protein V6D17_06445 [Candidatus Obscuribacterales bacterium]
MRQNGIRLRVFSRAIVSLALFVFLSTCFAPAVMADEAGWVLTQKSLTFGDQYLYISPSGFKCVNPRAGVAFVTRAPNWDVVMFNDRTRVCFNTTFEAWKRQLSGRMSSERSRQMSGSSWVRGGSGNIAGLRATQYVMQGVNAGLQRAAAKRGGGTISGADYWVADQIQVPPRLAEMLANIYGLPTTVSIPLRLTCSTKEGGAKLVLDTYRSQTCPIPISYYNAPSGYKPVQSDVEVMADEETKQMIDDMSRDLGTSGPGGTSRPITNQDLDKFLDAFKNRKR